MTTTSQNTDLTTTEKRKLDDVIQGELARAISDYESSREDEFDRLKKRYEANPPKDVRHIVSGIKSRNREITKLKKQLEALGYRLIDYKWELSVVFESYWEKGRQGKRYKMPELRAHTRETSQTLARMRALSNEYTLKVFVERKDLLRTFGEFKKRLAELRG